MPDTPEQRIADAIREYAQTQRARLPGYGDDPNASEVYAQVIDDAGHIAITITTALGLTEEWGSMERKGQSTSRHESLGDAQRHCRIVQSNWDRNRAYQTWLPERPDLHPVHRFVTPWRNAEEEQ